MDGTRSLISGGALMLYGVVDSYAFEGEGIRAIDVIDSLAAIKGNVVNVHINSPGGSVSEGIAIYNALRADGRKIVTHVDAMAASIASLIFLSGDERHIAEGGSVMIHDPWSVAVGGSGDMRAMADEIDRLRDVILAIYETRTGKSRDELSVLMSAETFMGAADAIANGFATHSAEPMKIAACALLDKSTLARLIGVASQPSDQAAGLPIPAATAVPKGNTMSNIDPAVAPAIVDTDAIRAEAAASERTRVREILALANKVKIGGDLADKLIADGTELDAARMQIVDAWSANPGGGSETRPAIVVTRDHTATRMAQMTDALMYKFGGAKAPSDAAREYMDFSIADMCAEVTNYRGRLSTPAAKESVIRNAMHTTSDFPALFENALNKSLDSRYAQATPTYRSISKQISYADFRAHPAVRMGDFPQLQAISEGGEIKAATFSEKKESTQAYAYGIQFAISRQMMVNDDISGISQVIASQGESVARFEDTTFYTMFLSASSAGPTLTETGRAVFNTTDDTKATSSAAIAVASLGIARAAIRNKTSLDGAYLNLTPSILLVGPDIETVADQYLAAVNPNISSSVNPFSGTLTKVVSPYLTGDDWYVLCNPSQAANFVWGLLNGYTAPRMRMEEPFGYQGMSISLEHDFGCGAVDFRAGFWNAGA